ncbi:cytosolic NiFe-hydrogenase subunit alpha [Geomonas silvestris]|uniref:Cytosolic NiFe-hydrogenase subunit alpha n=1 Tax=Geomonas silvestris TaxID=2740184 RepID=A0A6V8MK47_9BACT|nr:nickel-dependent hydrogenase large subunit [Geomonas silvestris]GFO60332.1 cytosolic NiFe-hydrogenase subunit alpha [Geomonas silvestris]
MGSVVEVNPLSRVEGHGTLRVYLEGRHVERVELCLTESPRLFEALLLGRSFAEVPDIICRICSLCSTVHKVTALLAVEEALKLPVSRTTRLTRELILHGGQLQSHALHLYCLLLPDLLEVKGVADLARQAPELLKAGLALKQVGNQIQEELGGRLIHPVNITLGGVGRRASRDTLYRLRDGIESVLPICTDTVQLFRQGFPFPPLSAPHYLAVQTGESAFSGRALTLESLPGIPVAGYREAISEWPVEHSHAKSARVRGLVPTVGALARLNLAPPAGGPVGELFKEVGGAVTGQDLRGNALAQALELYQSALAARDLVEELLEYDPADTGSPPVLTPAAGSGSAACEAPRGVLIHGYSFDASGLCRAADVITPTSLNQLALEENLLALAHGMEGAEPAVLVAALERLVRCFDPCISCAVHLVQL